MKKVVIVEDDVHIADLVKINIEDLDCEIKIIHDGDEALKYLLGNPFDLLILDINLPGTDGISICRTLRQKGIMQPVMMLTAKSEDIDKVLGLETGADDYITKPFSTKELMARVKGFFRRADYIKLAESNGELLIFKGLEIDVEKRKVLLNDLRIDLTPKEFNLLVLLATNPGKSYDRTKLLDLVWGYDFDGYEHTVNSHVNRLRSKIEKDPNKPEYILTTWGVGYRFTDDL